MYNLDKNYIFGILSSIGIYGSNRRGGGVRGGPEFYGPPLRNFTGPLLRNYKYITRILSSSIVDWDLFQANWVKGGGGCGNVQKSEAHTLRCRPRKESSQWSSNSPQNCRIVPAWDSQWSSEEMEAMWDCASQLWVPGRSLVHGRPYLSFCPITLQHFNFRSWWVCKWMPIRKRSRLVPFLSGWGHRKGGLGGGSLRGVHPKK